jgi:diguanylate cyclase (GGDEF)-like protein/putative nucleotidyltransferase with HDIG domain
LITRLSSQRIASAMIAIGIVIAVIVVARTGFWAAPLTFAPIYLTYRTYRVYMSRIVDEQRHVQQTSDLHLATIEALARAIDAKDQTTHMHIRRVQLFAAELARAAGLADFEIQGIKTAALLHDVGKLAIPEHILSKPGPLTDEEFQKVRIHPQVGAEIIAPVPFPYHVAPIVLSHHERWDGTGYPQGLAGEQIPLGARILTIADYFDAVTSDRPYHRALGHDGAVALLQREAGRALDPVLVAQFLELLPSLLKQAAPEEQQGTQPTAAKPGAPATTVARDASSDAFENIALAHREIYALYEIAQSLGTSLGVYDTMTLISSKLRNIIPWSSCALFLYQEGQKTLQCRFAAGVDANALRTAAVPIDSALSTWIAHAGPAPFGSDPQKPFAPSSVAERTDLQSSIVSPLYFKDGFIGCLALYHVDRDRYTENHRRWLERVSEQAGAVVRNSIVFEQTHQDALTDPLTRLPNRRALFLHLSRELSRAERLKAPLAVILMDLDGFKAINDTHGHHVGDQVLRELAGALLNAVRPYDLCVRYAGDEFVVVLTDCAPENAEMKARELQNQVEVEVEVAPGQREQLRVSAGVALYPRDGTTYDALIADADQRMYLDKARRRSSGLQRVV